MDDFRQMISLDELTSDATITLARTAAEAIRGLNHDHELRRRPGPAVGRLRRPRRPVPGRLRPAAADSPRSPATSTRPWPPGNSATTAARTPPWPSRAP